MSLEPKGEHDHDQHDLDPEIRSVGDLQLTGEFGADSTPLHDVGRPVDQKQKTERTQEPTPEGSAEDQARHSGNQGAQAQDP